MNKQDRSFTPPAVGGASLLVVFAVLCLTVFALLSLTTIRADERLSEASAKAVSDYYAADFEAERVFAELRAGEWPDCVSIDGNIYSYECPISETQSIFVELERSGNGFTVLRWQAASSAEVELDENLPVWDGSLFE